MHKAFPLPGESSHWQYLPVKVVPTDRRLEMPLPEVCTVIEEMMKKLPFRIQQYLQHEHYALWEVIEFGDSYKAPTNTDPTGRTITLTTDDMQKKKNDVKARTILLLSLPDEHQLRFSKYKTAKELWDAILKTFGGNEATKKRKKNLLKQQYGNFKAEGTETLEQTFNRLQVIDMAFISSSKNSNNEDGNTVCVTTASTAFPTSSVNVTTISQDTASAFIASQAFDLDSIKILTNEVETLKEEKDVVDGKLARLLKSSKDLENIIESQRSDMVKEGVRYTAVPPPAADLYLSPKKYLSWTGLPKFVDETVTDYSRPSPIVAFAYCSTKDAANQEVKKNESSLRYIVLPNWVHDALLESTSNVRSSNTPMDKENPWGKDGPGKDVELHLYRSMIGSLMYLTASRPDIMFAGHPKLGLWYPKASPFDLVAYSDSDYGGASQERMSTTGGSQFLGRRLISCQYKKQTIVATSTTEAEYVAAASCCGQVLWIQNQLLDYGEFEALMHEKFQMSAMGELNFFLGLQVLQKEDGIFLSQDKYIGDILKKFGFSDVRSLKTPMDKENHWGKDGPGKDVELHLYRSMIGSL
nr:uncharacterized mitochondrial protein AtMg00810-like [Tanacetum cinerariifolium]